MLQGKITEADTPTTRLGATPSELISNPPPSSPIFMPDALPAATLPTLSCPKQVPNKPAYILSGMVKLVKTTAVLIVLRGPQPAVKQMWLLVQFHAVILRNKSFICLSQSVKFGTGQRKAKVCNWEGNHVSSASGNVPLVCLREDKHHAIDVSNLP